MDWTIPEKTDSERNDLLGRSRKTGHKDKHLRILYFKLHRAEPAQSRMNSFGIVVGLNIFKDIHTGLFRIVIVGILNKLLCLFNR